MRVQICKYILTLLILAWISNPAEAKHIIGGDVFYECRGVDTILRLASLHFEFQMYRDGRDQTGADFDGGPMSNIPGAEFGVFRHTTANGWVFIKKTAPVRYSVRQTVAPNSPPCLITPPGIFVERAVYIFDIDVPLIADDAKYMVVYQRCCRSQSITNLVNPGNFGAAFAIELTGAALKICNNSPKFNEFPPLIICSGFPLEYDHSARDKEGHRIEYEFCLPLSAGGNPSPGSQNVPRSDCERSVYPDPQFCGPQTFIGVSFLSPTFEALRPMGGDPVIQVNPSTGLVSGTPQIIGEHVMAICAKEYDTSNVLLSIIRRDFQFIVTSCQKAVDAIVASDRTIGDNEFEVISCGDYTVNFTNLSVREQDISTYRWEFFDINGKVETSTRKNPQFTFPDYGIYDVKMTINPGAVNCTDSAFVKVRVYPGLEADFNYSYDTCYGGPVAFKDLSYTNAEFIKKRQWSLDRNVTLEALNPIYEYETAGRRNVRLEITDNNGCMDAIEKEVNYAPAPDIIIIEPSIFIGCEPAEVFFNNLTEPINKEYDITWNFGDGTNGKETKDISPTHVYTEDGVYSVTVDIISPFGCKASRSFTNWIRVQKGPDADFDFTPKNPNLFQNKVDFINLTVGGKAYYWDFAGKSQSFDVNPSYSFRDTGIHRIYLQAISENGCMDTISKLVDIIPVAELFFPNAFTPDGDGRNDDFKGVGFINLVNDYKMIIYDRWGKEVFKSDNPTLGWNGRVDNVGDLMPVGVYTYRVSYRIPRGEQKATRGFATLIR